jgi:hypothetical protein
MSDRPDLPVEALVEHWRRQVQKLREAGIPLRRISDSIRTAALEVEQSWFQSILEKAGERLSQPSDRLLSGKDEASRVERKIGAVPARTAGDLEQQMTRRSWWPFRRAG